MKINTTPGETYIVLSTGGCTATTGAGKQIKTLAAGQDFFTAMTGDTVISDDNASVTVAKGEILSLLNTDGTGEDVQATLRFQPVTSQSALPATGEDGVIYLVPNGAEAPNQYTEWVWTGAAYEQLGDAGVDLSGYAKLDAKNTFTEPQTFTNIAAMGTLTLPIPSQIELGASHIYVRNDGTFASLTHLSVIKSLQFYENVSCVGTLKLGVDAGFIKFGENAIKVKDISVIQGLYMPYGAKMMLTGYGVSDTHHSECDYIGSTADAHGVGRLNQLSVMQTLYLEEDIIFDGAGWSKLTSQIATAAVDAIAENDKESFTKLIFPPTGTATAEQDPSWITKKNILMETSGGQLNMTHLTETLAYAAQTPLAIAKRTLWLSTSPGTGDAVQWPANAVFPDDQPQDKIQQLNSNSTYWFDITYVGGSDTVLIRKVCSWASTTGESGPTE